MQTQIDNTFKTTIKMGRLGLNKNYSMVEEHDRLYFYSKTIHNLGAASKLARFTSYEQEYLYESIKLSNTINSLITFLIDHYSDGFIFDNETQTNILVYLHDIMKNPEDKNKVNDLYNFISEQQ